MELSLNTEVASLSQIGKSKNSFIYKSVSAKKEGISVLKIILHDQNKNIHKSECLHLKNEYEILKDLDHPNIIKIFSPLQENALLQKKQICCAQFELADCDLFDYLSKIHPRVLEPSQIRFIFLQVCYAVKYIHERQLSHNDIKLGNILIFKKNQVAKLADFGFASDQQLIGKQQYYAWKGRCKTMLAPEILDLISHKDEADNYLVNYQKSDIFALGITIFQSLFLRLPFEGQEAIKDDPMFKHFFEEEYSKFWKNKEISTILKFLDKFPDFRKDAFVDLLTKMLNVDPQKRINIQEVLQHQWFNIKQSQQTGCFSF